MKRTSGRNTAFAPQKLDRPEKPSWAIPPTIFPGVAGVGPKTAKELLAKFGSLDGVYAHLDDPSIRPKLREKLESGKENAYLSFDLATIRPEAPIDFAPKDAIVRPI